MALIFIEGLTCLACREELFDGKDGFCEKCYASLPFNDGAVCKKCGAPVPFDGGMCDDCKKLPREFTVARSAFRYEKPIDELLLGFKHYGKKALAKYLAHFMVKKALLFGADVLVPVPMHPIAEKKRGYNAAALMAKEISLATGIPMSNALTKIRQTETQVGGSREERLKNLKGCFRADNSVKGKKVLLIDDVMTTGTTASECGKALKKKGASVSVLTLARTVQTALKSTDRCEKK